VARASAEPRAGYGEAFRSREFRALFIGQSISIGGGSIAAVALTVLVFQRTGSPFLSSLAFALGFLPYVLGGMLSGIVDRVRPRALVNACDAASAAVVAVMAVPGIPVAVLLALLFGVGTLASLAGGARATLVRSTVPAGAYVPARSLMKIAAQTAQIGGNAAGGALVVALGTSGAILANATSFGVSFLLVRLVVADHANLAEAGRAGLLRDSLGGAREVFGNREVARLLALGWVAAMFSVAPEALAAPYVSDHHGSPALVGWWLAALPVGAVVGDVAGVRLLRPALQQRLVAPVAAAGFVPYLLFVLHPSVAVGVALLVVSGLFGMYSLGLDGRLRAATPDRLFARMMALSSAGLMTLQGLGFALAGALGQGIGASDAIAVAGVCGLVAVAALGLRGQARRPLDRELVT
jgi:predicted MFS family arabinose efflux permease